MTVFALPVAVPAIIRPAPTGYTRSKSGLILEDKYPGSMPGVFNPMFVGGAQVPMALSISGSKSQSGWLVFPATCQPGDLGLYFSYNRNTGTSTPGQGLATGFTLIKSVGFYIVRVTAAYKILTSGDINANINPNQTGSSTTFGVTIGIRPTRPISKVTAFSVNGEGTSSNPAAQTISTSGQTPAAILLGFTAGLDSNYTETGTLTTNGTEVALNNSGYRCWQEIQNTVLADRTFDMPDNGNGNILMSFGLHLE